MKQTEHQKLARSTKKVVIKGSKRPPGGDAADQFQALAQGVRAVQPVKGVKFVKSRVVRDARTGEIEGVRGRAIKEPQQVSALAYTSRVLGKVVRSEADFYGLVTEGLPVSTIDILNVVVGMDHDAIAPESTLRRRRREDSPLSTEESERAVRIARIFGQAAELFGSEDAAKEWMHTERAFIPKHPPMSPLELCKTDAGARSAETMLLKTSHGIF